MVLIGIVLAPFTLGLSLFFLLGGFAGIFGSKPVLVGRPERPTHPEKIARLINLLQKAQEGSVAPRNRVADSCRMSA